MRRVLVTGATGFIGRQTLEPLIENGFDVHATYLHEPLDIEKVTWHQTDLMDHIGPKILCERVHATDLLHFAWYVNPQDYKTSSENKKWVHATLSLLESFRVYGGMRAVLAGTCMEYDWNTPQLFLSETFSPLKPSEPYGQAKLETFEKASIFAKQKGLSIAWGRIFLLFGPYEAKSRLVPYVINSILDCKPAQCSSGEQLRDILYVKDVAAAFVALLRSEVEGAVNIGSGSPMKLRDIINEIADELDGKALLRFGARPSNEPPRLVFDTTRLTKEVGWEPRYTISEGVRETIAWWKANRA